MSRYIDAELLKQILKPREWGTPDERWIPEHEIGAMLDYFPAADVKEVRHGRWEKMDGTDLWCCSVCGDTIYSEDETDRERFHKWCGRCGARMDEVDK